MFHCERCMRLTTWWNFLHVQARFIWSEMSRKVQRALATRNRPGSRAVRRLAGAAATVDASAITS